VPNIIQCDVDKTQVDPAADEYYTVTPSRGSVVIACSPICLLRYAQKLITDANDVAQQALVKAQEAASVAKQQSEEADTAVADAPDSKGKSDKSAN
jgi:hypothetical protein